MYTVLPSSPTDVVILSAVRTPICRGKRGAFEATTPDILLTHALRAAVERSGMPPRSLGDVCVGNVLQAGGGAVTARMAQLMAGMPYTVPISAVNRQCSSGLQALANVYSAIKAGSIDAGIGAGVESMSTNSMWVGVGMTDGVLTQASSLTHFGAVRIGLL